jgi:hypothetical protein
MLSYTHSPRRYLEEVGHVRGPAAGLAPSPRSVIQHGAVLHEVDELETVAHLFARAYMHHHLHRRASQPPSMYTHGPRALELISWAPACIGQLLRRARPGLSQRNPPAPQSRGRRYTWIASSSVSRRAQRMDSILTLARDGLGAPATSFSPCAQHWALPGGEPTTRPAPEAWGAGTDQAHPSPVNRTLMS